MAYNVPIVYGPGGVNYLMPDTLRAPREAADGKNFVISDAQHLIKRPGWHQKSDTSAPAFGLVRFEKQNVAEVLLSGYGNFAYGQDPYGSPNSLLYGSSENQMIGLDSTPKLWTSGSFTVAYSGGGVSTITVSNTSDNTIKCVITDTADSTTTIDLGSGNEGSPVTVASLISTIDALSNFSATLNEGTSTTPAAFIDFVDATSLNSGESTDLTFGEWAAINTTVSAAPLSEIDNQKSLDTFENPSAISIGGSVYISNGFDEIHKYDGLTLYKAGMPTGSAITAAVDTGSTGSAGFSGVYSYKLSYKFLDNNNYTVEGHLSSESADVNNSAGPYDINVTCTNIIDGAGYKTNCAIIASTHTSTNVGTNQEQVTVDSGHTMQIGDRAYLYDANVPGYATYKVLATTSTTLTLQASSTISVINNQAISGGLRQVIWRTKAGGSVYYRVAEIPNNAFSSTQIYVDEIDDDDLGATYGDGPAKTPGTPPRGKYLTVWRNQLIVAGDPDFPENIYYSEYDGTSILPENFPGVNVFKITANIQSRSITALATLGRNLFIFTEDETYVCEGNLANDDIRLDRLEGGVGCVANHSIQNVGNQLIFLSKTGVYAISPTSSGYTTKNLSENIQPELLIDANNNFRRSFKRCTSAFWQNKNWYVLFLPNELTSGNRYATSSSKVFVYDLEIGQWFPWDNINAEGGMCVFDDGVSGEVVWFSSREDTDDTARTSRFHSLKSELSFNDHTDPVNCEYRAQWDFAKDPKSYKNYFEISLDCLRKSSKLAYTPTGDITINLYSDFDATSSISSFDVSYESDDEQIVESLPTYEMRALGVQFSNNTVNKQILITGWALESSNKDRRIRRG